MLKRKMMNSLIEWKNDPDRMPILLTGARQVGKTFIIDEFAKNNYKSYVYINFEEDLRYASIFAESRNVDTIMEKMSLFFKTVDCIPGETLIFLDEIQNCPDARVALKFFALDRRYDVIGSGSLPGVKYREVSSYPVGYINRMEMHSLDFEEFLWAMDVNDKIIGSVKTSLKNKTPIDSTYLAEFERYFRLYMVVGGMPAVVNKYIKTRHMGEVLTQQRGILADYYDDISKYAVGKDKNYAKACLLSIPRQLSRRNKKYTYADIESDDNARASMYGSSLSWLYDAGIINYCHNLQEPALPLAINAKDDFFKVYMRDTGPLISMMEDDLSIALMSDDLYVNEGAITENAVADMLAKNGFRLTYFEKKGRLEVNFVINLGGAVTAIEVKSGNTRQSKSLKVIMSDKYNVKKGIRLKNSNVLVNDDGIEHYPLFASAFISELR